MNIWWVIALSGLGTCLMRSTGVWLNPKWVQGRWLDHLPFAVILVIAIASLSSLTTTWQGSLSAIAASGGVIVASWQKLPLVVCVAIGCIVFGMVDSFGF
jgi:hypothetical protein